MGLVVRKNGQYWNGHEWAGVAKVFLTPKGAQGEVNRNGLVDVEYVDFKTYDAEWQAYFAAEEARRESEKEVKVHA